MNGLRVDDIYKSFGETRAVAGVSFEVKQRDILALLGPSGCGKSTVLAVIAGLEAPDQGDVFWDDNPLRDIAPHKRDFGLMFQDFALFPHMNVHDNVAFGLKMLRLSADEIRDRVEESLELVGLPEFSGRDVNTLSGGEQQRVALARSLAPRPRLLMLDEPLGSLDRNLREQLVLDLGDILRRVGQTAIYVTHDQEEAFALADRVAVMNAGRVEQEDTPQALYERPASIFVARFLGLTNLLPGEAKVVDGQTFVDTAIGSLPTPGGPAGEVTVLLRPDAIRLDGDGSCQLEGMIVKRSFRGSTCRAVIEVNGEQLSFDFLSSAPLPQEGEKVVIGFDIEQAIRVFPGD
jgi:ABC-type Fe3+/spermidine/putrescine transport system ATPase subunit